MSRHMKEAKKQLIISYQMEKVASSSITDSVDGVIQLHSWSTEEPIKYFSSRYTGSLAGRIRQTIKWHMRFRLAKIKIKKIIKEQYQTKINYRD